MDPFIKTQRIPMRLIRSIRLHADGLIKPKISSENTEETSTWSQRQSQQRVKNLDNLIRHLEKQLDIGGTNVKTKE